MPKTIFDKLHFEIEAIISLLIMWN